MRLSVLLTLAALALGGGCKSMSQTEPVAVRDDGVDRDQMGRVEQAAARSGARVQWVNPPLKAAK